MFQKFDALRQRPITFYWSERFKKTRPKRLKSTLGIGLYYNDDGIIQQLQAVAEAEHA